MVSAFDPAVLLTVAWLLVLFVAAWRYRWGSLPPARTALVVGAALCWLAFSLLQVADVASPPYDDVVALAGGVVLLAGGTALWRWWRDR